MDFRIRRLASSSDIHECALLMSSSEPWITLQRDYNKSLKVFAEDLNETYVADKDGQILGFIILQLKGAFVGYIRSLGVIPEMRGLGIGERLLDFAEKIVFNEHPNLFICVSSFNLRARELYERHGFKVVGELDEFIVPGHSEILMRKTRGPLCEFII
ncbi:MAG: GNAT family N-acetyltransferase [Methylocystaceae bacterium]